MKLRTVICDIGEDEIVISCRERDDKIVFLEDLIKNAIGHNDSLLLSSGETQYFIPIKEIIFCESFEGKTFVTQRTRYFHRRTSFLSLKRYFRPSFAARLNRRSSTAARCILLRKISQDRQRSPFGQRRKELFSQEATTKCLWKE
jgi:hypothetical protein